MNEPPLHEADPAQSPQTATRGELLRRLLAAHSDPAEFQRVAGLLIADEEQKGNRVLGAKLRKALDAAAVNPARVDAFNALPQEKDKNLPLTEVAKSSKSRSDIVLSGQNAALLTGVVEEFRRSELLRSHGLPVTSKLLFCGPPGCGKTLCAEVFAKEVGLPLIVAHFDVMVSSFLGETSTNLRRVFEFAQRVPCVLLLDEFDAVARRREDESEHGELKRVVNSLLQLIDRYSGRGFIIAATNHEAQLDSAIWRRFDQVVFFDKPGRPQVRTLLRMKLKNFRLDFDPASRVDALSGFSYAEIERVCQNAVKRAVLSGQKHLSSKLFDEAVAQ